MGCGNIVAQPATRIVATPPPSPMTHWNKSFVLLFFKKEVLAFASLESRPTQPSAANRRMPSSIRSGAIDE
jgi:hypothetical protein